MIVIRSALQKIKNFLQSIFAVVILGLWLQFVNIYCLVSFMVQALAVNDSLVLYKTFLNSVQSGNELWDIFIYFLCRDHSIHKEY